MCRPPQPSELVVDAAKDAAAAPKEEPLPYARTEHNKHFGVTEEQQGLILLVGLLTAGFTTTRFDALNTTCPPPGHWDLYLLSYIVRSNYNAYLEWAFKYPERRIQKDSHPSQYRDETQRTEDELALIEWHDRLDRVVPFCLLVGCYVYGGRCSTLRCSITRTTRTSTCSYAHRAPLLLFVWHVLGAPLTREQIPLAPRPLVAPFCEDALARTTYMDHWADNFFNAFICEVCAPIIVPLPFPVLVASRLFRICESLEKHSGLAGGFNIVHTAQRRRVRWNCCPSPKCRTTTTGTTRTG